MAARTKALSICSRKLGDIENVDQYIEGQLAEKKKIMGIGHRVYKTLDPRAPHLRNMAIKLSEKLGEPKWIKMSERIAELMKEKKEPQRQRRFLFGDGLSFVRNSDGSFHAGLRDRADVRLVRPYP